MNKPSNSVEYANAKAVKATTKSRKKLRYRKELLLFWIKRNAKFLSGGEVQKFYNIIEDKVINSNQHIKAKAGKLIKN